MTLKKLRRNYTNFCISPVGMEDERNADFDILVSLVERVKVDSSHRTNIETRLLEDAAIDSLALVDLADEVQRETKVVFLPEDYSFENLRSVRSILDLVNRRRHSGKNIDV